MIDLSLDPLTGDLVIPLQKIIGIDQIRQELASRLRFVRGEYYLDITVGVGYYGGILDKGASRMLIESEIKATIINTPGVVSLISFDGSFNPLTRAYTIDFAAQTTLGAVEVQVIL